MSEFDCQACGHTLPENYCIRTAGYCYLCDPAVTVQELLDSYYNYSFLTLASMTILEDLEPLAVVQNANPGIKMPCDQFISVIFWLRDTVMIYRSCGNKSNLRQAIAEVKKENQLLPSDVFAIKGLSEWERVSEAVFVERTYEVKDLDYLLFEKSPGSELIALERWEQMHKHGFDVSDDDYQFQELIQAALFSIDPESGEWPQGWYEHFKRKILSKAPIERLVVAGAFIAAEIDRLIRIEREESSSVRSAIANPNQKSESATEKVYSKEDIRQEMKRQTSDLNINLHLSPDYADLLKAHMPEEMKKRLAEGNWESDEDAAKRAEMTHPQPISDVPDFIQQNIDSRFGS